MISKTDNGKWLADLQPGGRGGKRLRKVFRTRGEAAEWVIWINGQAQNPEWMPTKKDKTKLSLIFEKWFDAHGSTLKDGIGTQTRLKAMAEAMGDPAAGNLTAEDYTKYRSARLTDGIKPATTNRELATAKAAINELIRLGMWRGSNPLNAIKLIKLDEQELSFLTDEQINKLSLQLQASSNPHVALIAKICLATGARWSESEEVRIGQLRAGKIQFARTKSSKARAVPIDKAIEAEIRDHHHTHGQGQRVFAYAYGAFREAIERAEIELPDGQLTHVLRHTFASYFIQAGRSILSLQKILGHHSVTMTMRYAHLAPDHLEDALRYNPLAIMAAKKCAIRTGDDDQ